MKDAFKPTSPSKINDTAPSRGRGFRRSTNNSRQRSDPDRKPPLKPLRRGPPARPEETHQAESDFSAPKAVKHEAEGVRDTGQAVGSASPNARGDTIAALLEVRAAKSPIAENETGTAHDATETAAPPTAAQAVFASGGDFVEKLQALADRDPEAAINYVYYTLMVDLDGVLEGARRELGVKEQHENASRRSRHEHARGGDHDK